MASLAGLQPRCEDCRQFKPCREEVTSSGKKAGGVRGGGSDALATGEHVQGHFGSGSPDYPTTSLPFYATAARSTVQTDLPAVRAIAMNVR